MFTDYSHSETVEEFVFPSLYFKIFIINLLIKKTKDKKEISGG